MNKQQILASILEIGVVPVVRTSSAESAIRSIEALHKGGIRSAEITMTVPGALHALEKIADQFGDSIVLGAGTVLDPETARSCMLAGAQFFVTPSLNLQTIEAARRYSKPIMPGALTPTEVLTAWEAGADAVKVFPASAVGGAEVHQGSEGSLPANRDDPDRWREPRHRGGLPQGGRVCGRRRRRTHRCRNDQSRQIRGIRGTCAPVPRDRSQNPRRTEGQSSREVASIGTEHSHRIDPNGPKHRRRCR